jgi:tetratricopeptide (TPR) repeat protein
MADSHPNHESPPDGSQNSEVKTESPKLPSEFDENSSEEKAKPDLSNDEELIDDLVDEEALKKEEESLTEEQFQERLEKAKNYKKDGNDQFGRQEYREAVFTYTKGLLLCPLREKEFRSILFANRSAAKIKMGLKQSAIEDCTHSLENKPDYVRALLRRAKLYEETERLEDALKDYNQVLELDPSCRDAIIAAQRLPGQIHEKNEKMKEEMLGKLKDLGNMVLNRFGLSTDNFKLQPNEGGGYSVNFSK